MFPTDGVPYVNGSLAICLFKHILILFDLPQAAMLEADFEHGQKSIPTVDKFKVKGGETTPSIQEIYRLLALDLRWECSLHLQNHLVNLEIRFTDFSNRCSDFAHIFMHVG